MVVEFAMIDFYLSKAINHQRSCVETPQQNEVVKRKHQHILNVARSSSFQSHLPITIWNFSIQHVVHIINWIDTSLFKLKTPYELLYKQSALVLIHLKAFGCLTYASTLQAHTTKFNPQARKTIFLGYKEGTK